MLRSTSRNDHIPSQPSLMKKRVIAILAFVRGALEQLPKEWHRNDEARNAARAMVSLLIGVVAYSSAQSSPSEISTAARSTLQQCLLIVPVIDFAEATLTLLKSFDSTVSVIFVSCRANRLFTHVSDAAWGSAITERPRSETGRTRSTIHLNHRRDFHGYPSVCYPTIRRP